MNGKRKTSMCVRCGVRVRHRAGGLCESCYAESGTEPTDDDAVYVGAASVECAEPELIEDGLDPLLVRVLRAAMDAVDAGDASEHEAVELVRVLVEGSHG